MDSRKWETSKRITAFVAAIFLLLILAVGSFGLYYRFVKEKISEQIHEQLKKATDLSLSYLQYTVQSQQERMEIIASFCDAPDGSGLENWRAAVAEFNNESFRLGVANMNGIMTFGSYQVQDVSGREYFKEIAAGADSAIELIKGGFDGKDTLVFATPFYQGKEQAQGILCAEYTTLGLGEVLNTVETQGIGATLVINGAGELVATYEGMEKFDTIYDMLKTMEFDSEDAVEQFRGAVKRGESGYMVYCNDSSRPRLLYYQPAGIEDWMAVSLVVMEDYQKTIWDIVKASYVLGLTIVLCGAGILFLFVMILILRKREVERAQRDFLTDVYDRKTAKRIFEKEMKKGEGKAGCCFFLDIDYFKQVNDTLGHDGGDRVLVEAAAILKQEMRSQDVISRYGGDEFSIWLWNLSDEQMACNIAKRLLNAFRTRTNVTISIGITFFGKEEDDCDAVIKRADRGLYRAKELGRDRYAIEY